jgi:Ca-activated chloride channel homolog
MRPQPLNFPRLLLFRVLPALLFLGACVWAWRSAEGSLTNLWLTPDQQGARLVARQRYAEAAEHFRDPLWQGTALYRDGQFEAAAAAFARVDSPEAFFDRGNALLMRGKYDDAITSYDNALHRRQGWPEARANRALAEARRKLLEPPQDDAGGTGGQLQADEIVFDDRPKQGGTRRRSRSSPAARCPTNSYKRCGYAACRRSRLTSCAPNSPMS